MAAPPGNISKPEAAVSPDLKVSGLTGKIRSTLLVLGPGLVTGASDDDPSGIATYSQVGAQFGYAMLWTMLLSYPLMTAIQEVSARIGRVTGCGISANLRRCYPRWLLFTVIGLTLVGNIFNLGADIGAMGAAAQLLLPAKDWLYVIIFGLVSLLLQVFVPYTSYVKYLKWLTLSLFAYIATAFFVKIAWSDVLHATFLPQLSWDKEYLTGLIAVLGTTISPYLFFWQASQEVEDLKCTRGDKPLKRAKRQAPAQLGRIRIDTYFGMALSNVVAFFIILTTAATLHATNRCKHGRASSAGSRPTGWKMGFNPVRLRDYRDGHAGDTRASGLFCLRRGRRAQLEREP
jgi:NRAMP (natural resistance-associated macrophage protein)-like metal ion transporter